MDDKDRDEAIKLAEELEQATRKAVNFDPNKLIPFIRKMYNAQRALEVEAWIEVITSNNKHIRTEAIKAERERLLSPVALSYIRELEHALCTMLPDGTSIDTVLMHPEKWRATYTDDKEVHRG
jgi:hypothetical protein